MFFLTFLFLMGNNSVGQRFSRIKNNPFCIIFDGDSEIQTYFSLSFTGCPALAVEVLTKLPSKVIESKNETKNETKKSKIEKFKCKKLETGTFDHSDEIAIKSSVKSMKTKKESMDWSIPEKPEPDELGLDWGPSSSVEKVGNDEGM